MRLRYRDELPNNLRPKYPALVYIVKQIEEGIEDNSALINFPPMLRTLAPPVSTHFNN